MSSPASLQAERREAGGWWDTGKAKKSGLAWTTALHGQCFDGQPVRSLCGSKRFTTWRGRRLRDIRAIYPRSWERSSKFQWESGKAAIATFFSFPPIYSTWQATLTHSSADVCSDSAGAQSPRGALVLCKLSDEILNSGQKESDRLCCSPSPSLWLRSRAQQRLRAHLYSWRSAACTSSNVLSLLRRKTDTLWAEEEKWGGGEVEEAPPLSPCHSPASCRCWHRPECLRVCACVAWVAANIICQTENWLA